MQCPSCGFRVESGWKVCPSCATEVQIISSQIQPVTSAQDSVIVGDQFSGNKADMIVINNTYQTGSIQGKPKPKESDSGIHKTVQQSANDSSTRKITCSRCKKSTHVESEFLHCIDPYCIKSMCETCYSLWKVQKMPAWQYCEDHTAVKKEEYEDTCHRCNSCNLILGYGEGVNDCNYSGCEAKLCTSCYSRLQVTDPLESYRVQGGQWNYCEIHLNESISVAEQQLLSRFETASRIYTESQPTWRFEEDKERLSEANSVISEHKVGIVICLTLLLMVYRLKTAVSTWIDGWIFTAYNIVFYWLLGGILILFTLAGFWEWYEYAKERKELGSRLYVEGSYKQFESIVFKPGQEVNYFRDTSRRGLMRSPSGKLTFERQNKSATLIDFDPVNESFVVKDLYSDGAYWLDNVKLKAIHRYL
jgi:hypothetical protein